MAESYTPQDSIPLPPPNATMYTTTCADLLVARGYRVSVWPAGEGRSVVEPPSGRRLEGACRAAHGAMAGSERAAGARYALTTHVAPIRIEREADIARLADAPWGALEHAIFTAHQMGGCAMGDDPATSVVSSRLRHHQISNLFVVDGSVFPTALGVNPSNTIYAIAHRARGFVADAV